MGFYHMGWKQELTSQLWSATRWSEYDTTQFQRDTFTQSRARESFPQT